MIKTIDGPLRGRRLWLFAGLLSLAAYGVELAHFTLSIDEEIHGLWGGQVWMNWLGQGRWGMALLTYLAPPGTIPPFLITLIFCAGLSISGPLFAGYLASDRREAYTFVAMFVSCPIWPHIGEFNTLSWGFGFGLVSCALALVFVRIGHGAGMVTSAGLLAFAISIYQTLLLLFLAVALLQLVYLAEKPEHGRSSKFRILLATAGSSVCGIGLYFMISKAALYLQGTELVYVQSWVRLSELLNFGGTGWQRTTERLVRLALGKDPIYLGWGPAVLFLPWVGLLVTSWGLARPGDKSVALRLKHAGIFMASALIAAAPVVLSAGAIAVRSLVALPAIYAVFAGRAMRLDRWRHAVPLTLLGLAVIANVWISTSLFNADRRARERDAALASTLVRRIEEVGRERFGDTIPFTLAGTWSPRPRGPSDRVEIFGTSFFEHGGGNVWRVFAYLKLTGFEGLKPVPFAEILDAVPQIEAMPSWPDPGSVAVVGDVVVVKLGDITPGQRQSRVQ